MINAKKEFIDHIQDRVVLCAKITFGFDNSNPTLIPIGHTKSDFAAAMKQIDLMYDSGFGGQRLYGTIWYTDGTWSTRGEYDGSEWWEHNELPEIPQQLSELY